MNIEENQRACELARVIMRSWDEIEKAYPEKETAHGLSINQIGKFLGPLDYNGSTLVGPFHGDGRRGGSKGLGCVASTVQWLHRSGYLELAAVGRVLRFKRLTLSDTGDPGKSSEPSSF